MSFPIGLAHRAPVDSSQVALGAKGKQTPKKAVKSGLPKIHSRFYAADDVAKPLPSRKAAQHPTVALKAGYAKGQVLILLAGRFRGKRVVFLGQTAAGLLLVCGAQMIYIIIFFRLY